MGHRDRGQGWQAAASVRPNITTPVTSGSSETNMEDPSGNTNFNAENLQAATGDYSSR